MSFKQRIKGLAGNAYLNSFGRTQFTNAGVVLMMHRVLADEQAANVPHRRPLCVGSQSFEHLLIWLKRYFHCVPLEQLLLEPAGKRPRLALTFDDGWRDNADQAYPLLERHAVPASIFLSTDFIGTDRAFWWEAIGETLWQNPASSASKKLLAELRGHGVDLPEIVLQPGNCDARSLALALLLQQLKRLPPASLQALADRCPKDQIPQSMDWTQVQKLESSGLVQFGPHGASHNILTQLDAATLRKDLARSHAELSNHCTSPLPIYCYPNGDHNAEVRRAVADLGYRFALGTAPGLVTAEPSQLLALPRIDVSQSCARNPAQLAWRLFMGARA